ncbi:hypothetical protein ACR780_09155 [Sphingobacterium faecium]|uniref:hypothetical protein n=1 Tax=Sphingobacterium faecium TaxID=34087 RepID=UPI003DA59B5B
MPWYSYIAGRQDSGNPNNYTYVGSTPPSCPSNKLYLCAIQAQDNLGAPDLTNINLFIEIANAINNRVESTNVKLRPTP